jgi:hypothetical protein
MSDASLNCSAQTRSELKQFMASHNIASYDAALRGLLNAFSEGHSVKSSASDEVANQQEAEPHMFSFAWFSDEPKAREYYSGLPGNAFDWLHTHLMPEVRGVEGGVAV